MTLTSPDRRHKALLETVPALPPSTPACSTCGADAYLDFDGFVPSRYTTDSQRLQPSVVSYTCEHCGQYYSHEVPDNWAPPGWLWYA